LLGQEKMETEDGDRESTRVRAVQAVEAIRRRAAEFGLDRLTEEEIEPEIAAAQRDHRNDKAHGLPDHRSTVPT